ncbi:hypothetical protein J5N97_010980 [Dioscorea zingiberensis]|uniref:Uncharacterized protein n=1 Tax=Dioscorea zingiberensis TaxID=325984 RepID=A0A9D5HMX2_9LILI|nr:hypothetical protein J5N97_010980 [Dioscorea zingiberensis]
MAMQQELDHHHHHEDDHPLHIAVFPWLAFGHMMPLLELSKTLANKGHHVSYLATPRNISRLSSTTLPSLLTFIPLPLPQTPGLPDFAEATSDVSPDQDLLQSSPPEKAPEARRRTSPSRRRGSLSPLNLLTLHGARNLMPLYESNASGLSDACRYHMTVQGCKALALMACMEVEHELVEPLEDLHEKHVLPLGLLAPAPPTKDQVEVDVEKHKEIFAWLDGQRERSVVYVAFGSEATLSVELLHELALGLELSNLPFLWVLRKPLGLGDGVEVLPLGFEERVRGRGVVVNGWVPPVAEPGFLFIPG